MILWFLSWRMVGWYLLFEICLLSLLGIYFLLLLVKSMETIIVSCVFSISVAFIFLSFFYSCVRGRLFCFFLPFSVKSTASNSTFSPLTVPFQIVLFQLWPFLFQIRFTFLSYFSFMILFLHLNCWFSHPGMTLFW